MDKIIHKDLSYKIYGLLFDVHRELGHFRNEKQYGDYFEKLLKDSGIVHIREYRFIDNQFGQEAVRCICDFIVDGKIIMEFKAKEFITKDDYKQVQRYLTTLNLELGIIVNFHQYRIYPKRVLNPSFRKKCS
jgi:hypothetical protein